MTPRKLTYIACTIPHPPDFSRACHPPARHCRVPQSIPLPPSPLAVSILRTCHQIYAEGLSILYAGNIFDFDELGAFNLLAASIPAQGLASITSLQLIWIADYPALQFAFTEPAIKAPYDDATYLLFWRTVATRMSGLKELRIGIEERWWVGNSLNLGAPWVRPVREVKGSDVFEVGIVEEKNVLGILEQRDVHEMAEIENFARELRRLVCRGREEDDLEDGVGGM